MRESRGADDPPPHHTVSGAGLLGGGSTRLRPGEISLAHHGVLFLDEVTEFQSGVLEGLREPLEEGRIRLARGTGAVRFPARFLLVAACNPCPCFFALSSRYVRWTKCAGSVMTGRGNAR